MIPVPAPGEVQVRVLTCGICRTDLHLAEGDLAPQAHGIVPGHQVVGEVIGHGDGAVRFPLGERIGIAWLRQTCLRCEYCRSGRENLCEQSRYTGWHADGGFADYCVVPESYAYRLPDSLSDVEVAPLLCAGIIGYRALQRTNHPPGGRIGLYGFGSSAHITAQIALALGAEVYVMTRGADNRALAQSLGVAHVGRATSESPKLLDSAILFAPAGEIVPHALRALKPGGTLVLAGIHMSDIPTLDYADCLFGERDLRSVTANTRQDGEQFLALAGRLALSIHTTTYGFDAIGRALGDMAEGRLTGSAVAVINPSAPSTLGA